MSTVDSINEAILALKTENIQYGGGQPGTNEAKAAFHLDQALELLAPEEPVDIPPMREESSDDPAEPSDSAVSTETGQEGEVSQEATEAPEAETAGVAVETVFTGESADTSDVHTKPMSAADFTGDDKPADPSD